MSMRLGVTGGIGSGKSYVCRILANDFGIPVYNCDIRARILTLSDPDVVARLTELDPAIYSSEGELDKARLASYLFASDDNYQRVNAIIHPAVRLDLHDWLALRPTVPIVAVESAILYESHFDTEVDRVLFVDAPLNVRIQRIAQRDGLDSEQIAQRMKRQQPDQARQWADHIVLNDGQADLHAQLHKILSSISTSETLTPLDT